MWTVFNVLQELNGIGDLMYFTATLSKKDSEFAGDG